MREKNSGGILSLTSQHINDAARRSFKDKSNDQSVEL
jgi:hypothetical protein